MLQNQKRTFRYFSYFDPDQRTRIVIAFGFPREFDAVRTIDHRIFASQDFGFLAVSANARATALAADAQLVFPILCPTSFWRALPRFEFFRIGHRIENGPGRRFDFDFDADSAFLQVNRGSHLFFSRWFLRLVSLTSQNMR